MDTLVGKNLEQYHILREIGNGGMGIIYLAQDTKFDRIVAVKVIHPQLRSSPKFFERFRREALSLARLEHTNIVRVLDFGEQDDIAYLVMPYLTGGTLADRMGAPVPYPIAAELLLPVAQALAHAHQRKVIHRDIKPTNILFDESGTPMITDFGLTKILEEETLQPITSSGMMIGTPEYMSPEQGQGLPVDYATDIYALGVIFYELVTGHKPFQGDSAVDILNQHIHNPPPSPIEWVPNLPEQVIWAINKALAKKPADRFESMEAFAEVLKQFAGEEEGFDSQTLPAVSTDRFIEEAVTRADEPETVAAGIKSSTEQKPGYSGNLPPSPEPIPPQKIRKPAQLSWLGGCLIGGALLVCCLLSLAAAAIGAYWVPIAREEGKLSFLATETKRPTSTRRPTKTTAPTEKVITEAPAIEPTAMPMPTVAEEPAGPVSLVLWTTETGESFTLLQEIANDFNRQNPNITLLVSNITYSDFLPMLETSFAAGTPPDLMLATAPQMRKYVENGYLYPTGKLVNPSQYFPLLIDEVRMNGEVWGTPWFTTGQLVLFYNKSLVEKPPQNSLQFLDIARKSGLSYFHRIWFFDMPWLGAFNGAIVSGESPIPQMNTQAMVQTLQFINDLTNKYNILPAVTEYGMGDDLFLSGQTGMSLNGSWAYSYYKSSLGDQLGVAPLPIVSSTGKAPSVLVYGIHFFAANQQMTPNKTAAVTAFLQYASSYEYQIQIAQRLNALPALAAAYGDPAVLDHPLLKVMAMQIPNGKPEWMGMNWTCVYTSADPLIASMLDGQLTPEQAAEQMQRAAEDCIANSP